MDGSARSIAAAGLSLVAWLLDGTVYWAVGQSLGLVLSPTGAMVVVGVTVLGTIVPSAPGYVGTFELAASRGGGLVRRPARPAPWRSRSWSTG